MARKSQPSPNPIRTLRLEQHKTLEEFAHECKIHLQAVYLNEMGMYPNVLPSIQKVLTKHGIDSITANDEYEYYVAHKRFSFGDEHSPYELPPSDLSHGPLRSFREKIGFNTAFGFAIAVAINPTVIRRVEMCKVEDFPGQLNLMLRDIKLDPRDIAELQYRHREYYYSGLRFKAQPA